SPPSRSSTASNAPVEAPLGTAARATVPSSSSTSTSTVGLPRESRISRAPRASMAATSLLLMSANSRAARTFQSLSSKRRARAATLGLDHPVAIAPGRRAQRGLGVDPAGPGERDNGEQQLADAVVVHGRWHF